MTVATEIPRELAEVIREAAERKLTGTITLHFADGQLKQVEEHRKWRLGEREVRG